MSPRITHRSSLITRFTRLALVPALLPALLLSVLLQPAGVALAAGCEVTGPQSGDELLPVEQRALLNVARQLPLEVKIGQLLMPGFVGTAPDGGLLDRARRGHIGGFFFLGRNVRDTAQVRDLTAQLSRATAEGSAGILPFMATDFEGGMVNALRAITGNTTSAAAMAAGGVAAVEARGAHDAAVLKSLGFNVNLAPVADVLSSPSQVIGSRAFSSDPATAATLSRAYLRGLQGGGVLGVMKHFPGHGATAGDSHVLLPTVPRSLTELEAADLLPYRQAFEAGEAQAVMVGHLLVPALDPERPTSISPPAVAGLLRDRMRFDGVVLTDELKMGAVSRRYSVGQAAVMAIQAGVDVILADYTSAEQDAVSQTLAQACRSGQLPPGRLERSVVRVLRLKLAYGLAGPQITAGYAAQMAAADAPPLASLPVSADPDLGGLPLAELPDGASGRLYTEAAGSGDFGYAVTDEGGVTFWRSYADVGGPPVLGYPISQRFELDGSTVQATQRALLRWDPERQAVTPANVFELFDRAGALLGWPGCATPPAAAADAPAGPQPDCSLDGWLAQKGIPPAIRDDGAGGDFRRAVATRLTWLEHEAIRAAFLADPAGGPESPWPGDEALAAGLEGTPDDQIPWVAIERYGLPMSRPQRFGPFITQRFQRVALQLWLDEVPGMPKPGTVTPVLAGELLREAGLIPAGALVPITADGAPGEGPALPAPPPPGGWPPTPTPAPTAASIQPTPTPASPQPTPTRAATQTPPTATPTRAATSPPAAPATQR